MSAGNVIHTVSFDGKGAQNGTKLGFQVPTGSGDITILEAVADVAGTASIHLITLSNAGTPAANGTVSSAAVGGTCTAGVPKPFTIDTDSARVQEGYWVGIKELNVGAATSVQVTVSYVVGV